jgi:TP901 family phage tail tape measure protein
MAAGKVRQGQVYVEIGADPSKFFNALSRVNRRIAGLGREMSGIGARVGGLGMGMVAPFAAAVTVGARFQDAMLAVQASTGATAAELSRVRDAAMGMSQALGVGPTAAAQGMLELLKAGMSLDAVLGGAGRAALQFAKVGNLDVPTAAVVMSDAMNVFKVSAETAANTLSAAADASSTSIEQMAIAFSMSSAVAALANQSIGDLSAALAVMANAGVKGSDAGTSVKTMLMRLMAPADDAVAALDSVGLSVQSFRNADGTMKPMVEIIGTLTNAMQGLDQAAKDDLFRRIFGQDAIRAASILTSAGVDGFQAMQGAMGEALPVGEKYKTLMGGLAGAAMQLMAAMERLGIAISDAVGGALQSFLPLVLGAVNAATEFATKNAGVVRTIAQVAIGAIAAGAGLSALGGVLRLVSFGLGSVLKTGALAVAPLTMLARLSILSGRSFSGVARGLLGIAGAAVSMGSQATAAIATMSAGLASMAAATAVAAAQVAGSLLGGMLAGVLVLSRSWATAFARMGAAALASLAQVGMAGLAAVAGALAPFAAVGLAVAVATGTVLAFRDQLAGAFSGVGGLVSQASEAIGSGFNQAVADGAVVFGDLYRTATVAFQGIYDSIAAGDLAGAMEILWAGLKAGWLRGSEAVMSYADSWIAAIQNLFTDMGTGIAIIWDQLWTALATNTFGATILGIFDNIANGVMATWDALVAAVQKGWIRVQGFISGAKDTQERIDKIDNENAARAEQRAQSRPGVEERQRRAREESGKMRAESQARQDAMGAAANEVKASREAENKKRADERRAQTVAAENEVATLSRRGTERRAVREQASELEQSIAGVQSMDELQDLAAQFHALAATGQLTEEQMSRMRDALGDAQERIAAGDADQAQATRDAAKQGAAAAGKEIQQSKAEVAGTFSARAAEGMGFGATLQERIAKAAEETAANTRGIGNQRVVA